MNHFDKHHESSSLFSNVPPSDFTLNEISPQEALFYFCFTDWHKIFKPKRGKNTQKCWILIKQKKSESIEENIGNFQLKRLLLAAFDSANKFIKQQLHLFFCSLKLLWIRKRTLIELSLLTRETPNSLIS